MVIAVQILLLVLMISISPVLMQVTLANAATENNSSSTQTSVKNEDVFALLQLEKDVAKYEGSLKELHSGKKSPFDLLGEIKNGGKFKPESGSILPEFDENLNGNDK